MGQIYSIFKLRKKEKKINIHILPVYKLIYSIQWNFALDFLRGHNQSLQLYMMVYMGWIYIIYEKRVASSSCDFWGTVQSLRAFAFHLQPRQIWDLSLNISLAYPLAHIPLIGSFPSVMPIHLLNCLLCYFYCHE